MSRQLSPPPASLATAADTRMSPSYRRRLRKKKRNSGGRSQIADGIRKRSISEWKVCSYVVTLWQLLLSVSYTVWRSLPKLRKALWAFVHSTFELSWCSPDGHSSHPPPTGTTKFAVKSPSSNSSKSNGRSKGKRNGKRPVTEDSSFAAALPRRNQWPTPRQPLLSGSPGEYECARSELQEHRRSISGDPSSPSSVYITDSSEPSSDECGEDIDSDEFYQVLKQEFVLSEAELYENGYPLWTYGDNEVRVRPSDFSHDKYIDDEVLDRVCARCTVTYRLSENGHYCMADHRCKYHWGRALKMGETDTRYNCCNSPGTVLGCVEAECHVTDSRRKSELKRFVATPTPKGASDPRSRQVYALDCEMLYSAWGPAVARITLVDIRGTAVFDEIIRPEEPVVDCNTRFTGLAFNDIENSKHDLNSARKELFQNFINSETILIGHALENDLKVLRIVHKNVVDTAIVFPHRRGPPFKRSLKQLALEYLNICIQNGQSGHDSREDANACVQLMLRRVVCPD